MVRNTQTTFVISSDEAEDMLKNGKKFMEKMVHYLKN